MERMLEPQYDQLVIPGIIDFERIDFAHQDRLQAATLAVSEMRHQDQQTRLLVNRTHDYWEQLRVITAEPTYIASEFALSGYVKARTLVETLRQQDFLQNTVIDLGDSPYVPDDRRPLKDIEKPDRAYNMWFYGEYVASIVGEIMAIADRRLFEQMVRQSGWGKHHDFAEDLKQIDFLSEEGKSMGLDMTYAPYSRIEGRGWADGFRVSVEFGANSPGIYAVKNFRIYADWKPQVGDYNPEIMSWAVEYTDPDSKVIKKTEKIVLVNNWVTQRPKDIYWMQETHDRGTGASDIILMCRSIDSLGEVQTAEARTGASERQKLQRIFNLPDDTFTSELNRISIV